MKTAEELAEEHWETYTKIILEAHEDDKDLIRKIGVHYVTAMVHGLKHNAEKLKAIKKLLEKGPHPHDNLEDYQQAVDDWLGTMMNVLEGEE